MTINVCTCITSFVERVMRLGVEKRPISSMEKDCTFPKSLARTVPPNPVAIRAAHTAVATDASKLPREHDSILPPAARICGMVEPSTCTSRVISAMYSGDLRSSQTWTTMNASARAASPHSRFVRFRNNLSNDLSLSNPMRFIAIAMPGHGRKTRFNQ